MIIDYTLYTKRGDALRIQVWPARASYGCRKILDKMDKLNTKDSIQKSGGGEVGRQNMERW
jgi:hypothetical protein